MKTPFETQDEQLESIVNELHTIASKTNPFALHVGKVGSFAPVNNVLYFKVEKTPELTFLNEEMHSGFFTQEREYAFVPHLTIGQGLSDAEHADVLGRLRMKDFYYEQPIDRFHLLYQIRKRNVDCTRNIPPWKGEQLICMHRSYKRTNN